MIKKTKGTFIESIGAIFFSTVFAIGGIIVTVLLNLLVNKLSSVLYGSEILGIITDSIADVLFDGIVGSVITFVLVGLGACMAGVGYWSVFCDNMKVKSIGRVFALHVCFLIGLAATLLSRLLIIAITVYLSSKGSVNLVEALKMSPELYIYSEKIPKGWMMAWRTLIIVFNASVGFGLGLGSLKFNLDAD